MAPIPLIPYGQTDPIGHQGKEPARVAVAVVIGAEVLEIHGRSAMRSEAARAAAESILPIDRAKRQAVTIKSPIHIEAIGFVTECDLLNEAVVTLLQTRYTGSFFSYNVKLCDRPARCLSKIFPQFDPNIGHLGGSGHRELSQFKLRNNVVNRDSYACISGRLRVLFPDDGAAHS